MGGTENVTISECADQARGEAEQLPTGVDGSPKKSAAVVQAVVDDAQRQMEMDFVGQVPSDDLTQSTVDEDVRTAVEGLSELEKTLKQSL